MQQLQPVCRHQERQVNSNSFFMLVLFSTCVCTTCLNDLDSPGISILLCQCCPCHYMVCSRTPLVLSPHAHPKAWWSRSHACMMDGLLLKDFLSAHGPSCSQLFLCTTWLHQKALALLPGFSIVVSLPPVLNMVVSRNHLIGAMNAQTAETYFIVFTKYH